ncbi:MAG: hypothetical protein NT062_08740 [Proteobacteria bacterium]|nr:hypothetical protein [Pseudomonadota bacterium]
MSDRVARRARVGLRVVVMLGLGSVASVAHADAKADVTALVTKNLAAIEKNKPSEFSATLRKDGFTFVPSTDAPSFSERFYGYHSHDFRHVIDKLVVVVDEPAKVAWFHVQWRATYDVAMVGADGKPITNQKDTMRAIGVAIEGGDADRRSDRGWKIAAVMYGSAFDDKWLFKNASEDTKPGKVTVRGDHGSADAVATWFAVGGSIAATQAPGAVVVSGTAALEYGADAAAARFVGAWDKLRLFGLAIKGMRWGTSPIAFVKAEVAMPVKGRGATKMRLGAVMIFDGKAWKWVAISFFGWFDDDMYSPI